MHWRGRGFLIEHSDVVICHRLMKVAGIEGNLATITHIVILNYIGVIDTIDV